jgi:aspartate aminotransferase
MEKISFRVRNMKESATLKMTQAAREKKNKGIEVISLSIGEPDFDTPDYIKDAAISATKEVGMDAPTHYPPVGGYDSLRDAICKKLKDDNNLDYKRENIIVSAGAKHSLMNVVLSIVDQGDEVIIPAPYWVSYRDMVEFAEGIAVEIPCGLEQDFKVTPQQIREKITKYTRAIMLNSPSNPSGKFYTKKELSAIADMLAEYPNIIIISDEIYEHINFTDEKYQSIAQFDKVKDRVVIINGVSKGYAMTGWRVGYIAAPKYIVNAVQKLQGQFTSGVCGIAQRAAEAALKGGLESINKMTEIFKQRRNLVYTLLRDIPGLKTNLPDGAFYFFPDVSNFLGKSYNGYIINDTDELALSILNNADVAVVGGVSFGMPNYIRLSYATSENNLKEAMKKLKKYFSEMEEV